MDYFDTRLVVVVTSLVAFLLYLLASMTLVPYVARVKQRTGIGWMLTSLLFSPLLALVALAALPAREAPEPINPFDADRP
jgi:hypothetical protein